MQHGLGIDLGTTYSVLAVKGNVTLTEGFNKRKRYLADCDVTIIPSPAGNLTFPSVFWVNPEDPNDRRFGEDAKVLAQEGEEPIMFSKRSIGTDEPLRIGSLSFDAKTVARELLGYLKFCAEHALGETVSRAVITHPADFVLSQVRETREAATMAGFEVSRSEQLIMEPVAAALCYTISDGRDPLTLLTYDLGGGTLDVSVVERRAGLTRVIANHGSRVLGGFNFDRRLVEWILDQQRLKGREIAYDDENPADRSRRAHLLQFAETFKENLTSQRSNTTWLNLKLDGVLFDTEGQPVQVSERMNREEYAAIIEDYLDETIEACKIALSKASLSPADVDMVLLVGGSTYGQWVKERVAAEFAAEIVQYEPDLCVAAGAAIQAALLPPLPHSLGGVRLVVEAPTISNIPEVTIVGLLTTDENKALSRALLGGASAILRIAASGKTIGPVEADEQGRFLFTQVDLDEVEPARCELVVSGPEIPTLESVFSIAYAPGGNVDGVSATLPKSLFVRTVGGPKLVAAEGVALPFVSEPIHARTVKSGDRLPIEFIQGETKVGEAVVENIPLNLPPDSPVVMEISITGSNQVSGMASVLRKQDGEVVARSAIRFEIPRIALPDPLELQVKYDELEAQREQDAYQTEDPLHRLDLEGKIKRLSDQISRLLNEQAPDRHEINEKLRELERLLNPQKSEMDPSESRMDALAEDCRRLLEHRDEPDNAALWKQFTTATAMALEGRTTRNERTWKMAYEILGRLRAKLDTRIIEQAELPETSVIKDHYLQECDKLEMSADDARDVASRRDHYDALWQADCNEVDEQIRQIRLSIESIPDDMPNKTAQAKCVQAMGKRKNVERLIALIRGGIALH